MVFAWPHCRHFSICLGMKVVDPSSSIFTIRYSTMRWRFGCKWVSWRSQLEGPKKVKFRFLRLSGYG